MIGFESILNVAYTAHRHVTNLWTQPALRFPNKLVSCSFRDILLDSFVDFDHHSAHKFGGEILWMLHGVNISRYRKHSQCKTISHAIFFRRLLRYSASWDIERTNRLQEGLSRSSKIWTGSLEELSSRQRGRSLMWYMRYMWGIICEAERKFSARSLLSQGKEVSTLSDFDNVPTSPYTYWISPQSGAPPSDSPPQRITVSHLSNPLVTATYNR